MIAYSENTVLLHSWKGQRMWTRIDFYRINGSIQVTIACIKEISRCWTVVNWISAVNLFSSKKKTISRSNVSSLQILKLKYYCNLSLIMKIKFSNLNCLNGLVIKELTGSRKIDVLTIFIFSSINHRHPEPRLNIL